MPTRSAANHRAHCGQAGGISVLGAGICLTAAALKVLDLLAGAGCILGTGHLSPAEGRSLIRATPGVCAAWASQGKPCGR